MGDDKGDERLEMVKARRRSGSLGSLEEMWKKGRQRS